MRLDISKMLYLLIIIFAFVMAARILGLPGSVISMLDNALYVFILVVMMVVCILVGRYSLERILGYVDDSAEDGRDSSAYPLLSMVVNLVIILVFLYVILKHLGFDLMIIATSLGIIGLAISFSAKTSLEQLFAGIGIILNGTIKTGDMVRLGKDDSLYRVVTIGAMTTTLQSKDGSETVSLPNNMLATSMLTNLSTNSLPHSLSIFMNISNGVFDFDVLTKRIIDAACTIEHVVSDGSAPLPSVSLVNFQIKGPHKVSVGDGPSSDFQGSAVTLKITVYVDESVNIPLARSRLTYALSTLFPVDKGELVRTAFTLEDE